MADAFSLLSTNAKRKFLFEANGERIFHLQPTHNNIELARVSLLGLFGG
jgi:hypothetical protein